MIISDYFGENVFSRAVMQQRLPKEVYDELLRVEKSGGRITMQSADVIA